MEYVAAEFKKEHGIDLLQDRMATQRLKEAAEKAKIELSGLQATNINLPFISAGPSGPLHLDMLITRAKFNELTKDLVEATMGPTHRALADAGPPGFPRSRRPFAASSGRSPTRASTPMSVCPSARPSRPECWPERSRTLSSWTSSPCPRGLKR